MKIIIAGDFCPQNRVAELIEKEDFQTLFGNTKDILSKADYRIVNFECPVINGREKPIVKQGPNLQCSSKGIEAVKWAGFNCVTLANNHFRDYGDEGVKNTIDACKDAGIDSVGGGMNLEEATRILYKQIGDHTLAVINCCEHEFSIATETQGGANPLNPIQQYYAIKEAKEKADYVLVIVHGGHEHWQLPSPRMQEAYRFFVDAGADAVVNHHQHCYSGFEVYSGKPIFYGLGNFCFDWPERNSEKWNHGYMVCLDLYDSIGFKIIPYKQCADTPVVEILPDESFGVKLKELNSIIKSPYQLKEKTEEYYYSSATTVSRIFEPIDNRILRSLQKKGVIPSFISIRRKIKAQDFICCEAHRDKLLYWLNKQ